MEEQHAGWQYRSESKYGTLLHAKLRPAQENSGRLVTLVKQKARLQALDNENDYVIVDGPPGIGCPVISAASGADLAVIVVEPTVAGVHDLDRALDTVSHFNVPATVVVNKADINPAKVAEIADFCAETNLREQRAVPLHIIGEIPFDTLVTKAMVQGLPVTSFAPDSEVAKAMVETWRKVKALADSLEEK
jgi:MinD superfamily P-loop ATPase